MSKSHTSIGVSTELLLEPESYRDQVSGTIEADVRTRVSCGHVGDIAGAFLRAAQGIELPEPQESLAPQRWLLRFSVGENDFQFRWPSDLSVANRGIRVVPIYDFLTSARAVYEELGIADDTSSSRAETGLLEIATTLLIPVRIAPTLGTSGATAPPPMMSVFVELANQLVKDAPSQRLGRHEEFSEKFVNIAHLRVCLKRIGLPRTLRRSILSAFELFEALLSDYQYIASVFTVYDAFLTLYRLLCHDVQLYLEGLDENERYSFCDDDLVGEIHLYIDAIWSSLRSRFSTVATAGTVEDLHYGWQTNARHFVDAADSVLKCGVGIARAINTSRTYNHFAAILSLSEHPTPSIARGLLPRKLSHALNEKSDFEPGRLSRVRIDFSSIFSCLSYSRCLHEAFHMVGDSIGIGRSALGRESRLGRVHEEVFVLTLIRLFVFGGDSDLFLKHGFCGLSITPASNTNSEEKLLLVSAEYFVSHFFVDIAISKLEEDQVVFDDNLEEQLAEFGSELRENLHFRARTRFKSTLNVFRRFFVRYYLWKGTARDASGIEDAGTVLFKHSLEVMAGKFALMWEGVCSAIAVYERFARSSREPGDTARRRPVDQELERYVQALENATPGAVFEPTNGESPDQLRTTCGILRAQLATLFADENTAGRIPTFRRLEGADFTGDIDYGLDAARSPKNGWAVYQVDPLSSGLRCSVSNARRKKLQMEVVSTKILVNIGAQLASRRVRDMVERVGKDPT